MAEYRKIERFTTHLRAIPGLKLFHIFTRYTAITQVDRLFNYLATKESEEVLRTLERLWDEFIRREQENVDEGKSS